MDCSTPGLSCPSPAPGACSNSCPLGQWCHPTISSSVVHFSSCPQSFPVSGSSPMSQFFVSGGQSIGPLKKGMANHISVLALKTPWTVWKGCSIPPLVFLAFQAKKKPKTGCFTRHYSPCMFPAQSLEVGFSQGALVPPSREGAIEAKIWILWIPSAIEVSLLPGTEQGIYVYEYIYTYI